VSVDVRKLADKAHDSTGVGHNHSHEVPQSIAAVAWMVIVGDGIHNFADGLAVGLTVIIFTSAVDICKPFYRAMLCMRGTSHGPVSICLCLILTSQSSTKTAKRRIT